MLRDLINDENVKNSCSKFIKRIIYTMSCDQKKTFDNISHEYLFGLLKHVNLGTFMFENIKRVYADSYTNYYYSLLTSNLEKFL